MSVLDIRLLVVAASTAVLVSCGGGGSGAVPADGEIAAGVEAAASDAATAVEGAVAQAGDAASGAVEQVAETTAAVADAVSDAGWTDLQEDWQGSIGLIKDRWAELTEEELLPVNGDREGLVALIQERYGLERADAESEVDNWASTL